MPSMLTGCWDRSTTWRRPSRQWKRVRSTTITRFSCTAGNYRIESSSIAAGLRGAAVRVEKRLDGEVHVRFRERYLALTSIDQRPQPAVSAKTARPSAGKHPGPSPAMRSAIDSLFRKPGPPVWRAGHIDRTRTSDKLD